MSQESILGPYLKPGTPIKVGSYSTKIIRYLSEGGFSHVYTAKLDIPVKGSDVAVLKRIVAPDKAALAAIRTEVETMKKLKGHRYIVTYIDSHASALKVGGFEVYVLMEYCPGGGLIDFMNTRLQTRLAEWEVLKIISDTTEAVACMHYLKPPLLHRDLKIENVLISGNGDYKLCDFGSCTEPRAAANNSEERRVLEEDIQKNTTIQYRSPEMVDIGRRLPIDEKSDIWALGVLLYKLCYFTTPFESQGQLAILNAAYTFPPYPPYTDRTKRLIAVTLQENPKDRPNIYQLLAEICAMRNVPVPIPDIYSKSRSSSQAQRSRPNSRPPTAHNDDILTYETAAMAAPKTPLVDSTSKEPMRRGRPIKSSSPVRQDPLLLVPPTVQTATESSPSRAQHGVDAVPAMDVDEFATKFPTLEELALNLDDPSQVHSGIETAHTRETGPLSSLAPRPASRSDLGAPDQITAKALTEQRLSRPLPQPPQNSVQDTTRETEDRGPRPGTVGKTGQYYRNLNPSNNTRPASSMLDEGKPDGLDNQTRTDLRVSNSSSTPVVRPKPIHLERPQPNDNSKASSNPYDHAVGLNDHLRNRPQMVNRSSQTSPKPKQAMQTQTSPVKQELPRFKPLQEVAISSNLVRDSSGFIVTKPMQRAENQAEQQKPQYKFTTSVDRPKEVVAQSQSQRLQPESRASSRPPAISIEPSLEFLRGVDSPLTNTTSSSIEANRTGNSLDSDIGRPQSHRLNQTNDGLLTAANIRRSVSVSGSGARHTNRPSLSSIPSFSGAAKNIMNSKFGDAFKKFETSTKGRGSTPHNERSNPLQVAEDDLPEHVTQHLQTTEARRSSSYSRNRPSFEAAQRPSEVVVPKLEKSASVESSSTSVKEAMRRLNQKANQTYVPQRSAQGYGKYTEPSAPHRAATVIPYARSSADEKGFVQPKPLAGKNSRRYGLPEEDDDSANFTKRYPSLSDFKV